MKTLFLAPLFAVLAISVATEHFAHQAQPNGVGNEAPGYDHIAGRTLAEIPDSELAKQPSETPLAYVSRITDTVHQSTYHCLPTDNTLSWIEGPVATLSKTLGYDPEFQQGLFGKRMKCGFCSERAAAVARILNMNGLKTTVWGLGAHVVARVFLDGQPYYADPDFGASPYRADLPKSAVKMQYLNSQMPKLADYVAELADNKSDDRPYYSNEYFDSKRAIRHVIYVISDVIACVLMALAAFLIALAGYVVSTTSLVRNLSQFENSYVLKSRFGG